jgi:hypothetical protein
MKKKKMERTRKIGKQKERNHGGFYLLGPRKVWGAVAKSSTGRP